MKTWKKWLGGLAVGIGLTLAATPARAVYVSSDSLTVTITPNAAYALDITTGSPLGFLDLGNVALGASTFTIAPATVTIGSSFATTDVRIVTQITGGWSLDTQSAVAPAADTLQAWAVFTDTGVPANPTGNYGTVAETFGANGNHLLGTSVQYAGTAGAVTQYVETAGTAGYKSMDDNPSALGPDPAGATSHLWLKFKLPGVTSTTNPQNITVTLGAAPPMP